MNTDLFYDNNKNYGKILLASILFTLSFFATYTMVPGCKKVEHNEIKTEVNSVAII